MNRPATLAGDTVVESTKANRDVVPLPNPNLRFWLKARPIYADKGKWGEPQERYRTEIRSRWTCSNLYFLFTCPYEELNLKPSPSTKTKTFRLWDWDVAEVFIGSDFQNIRRYKEFEVSPQGEWVDLDIELSNSHHEDGWTWNSGFTVAARIDPVAKVWYGAMRIPFVALQQHPPRSTDSFRINFFRSQGPGPLSSRVQVAWQPPMNQTFHVPERFGLLLLTDGIE